jgi:hypothetical protein
MQRIGHRLSTILALGVVCASSGALRAGIVSFSGVTPLAGPPAPSVLPGAQPPLPTPIVFRETSGVVGAGGLPVDHRVTGNVTAAPVETGGVVNPVLVSGSIPAGTPFESYLFHFDPADVALPSAANFYPLSSILFSNQILGVQLFSNGAVLQKPDLTPYTGKLEAGDAEVAADGGPSLTYYPSGLAGRGMEVDSIAITNAGFGINLSGEADAAAIDQIRIIVSVPEPAAALGLLLLTGTCATLRRARRGD